jgi:hypothetical protein
MYLGLRGDYFFALKIYMSKNPCEYYTYNISSCLAAHIAKNYSKMGH